MKLKLSIGRKIGSGFAIVVIVTLVVFGLTFITLKKAREVNDQIDQIYNPSVAKLEQLKNTLLQFQTGISMWALVQSREDTPEKRALIHLVDNDLRLLRQDIDSLSMRWEQENILRKNKVFKNIDELIAMYMKVRTTLVDMQSYEDPFVRFTMADYTEDDGLINTHTNKLIAELDGLIDNIQHKGLQTRATMISSFDRLEMLLRTFAIVIFLVGGIIGFLTVRSIVQPVRQLRFILLDLRRGVFPQKAEIETGDEIGEMSHALAQFIEALKRTTDFARQVGRGHFNTTYKALSNQDQLGMALLKMREELKENERILEEKVKQRTEEVETQSRKVSELYKNITDSIKYAKRLQENILPSDQFIKQLFKDSFIYFKPRDIVSGDFYFFDKIGTRIIFAAVDCTGHGVPGAFMSLVGNNALKQAIKENQDLDPGNILSSLSTFSAKALNQTSDKSNLRDGMDISLCVYDTASGELSYSGAFNPLYIARDGEILVTKADKAPIGSAEYANYKYTTRKVDAREGDMVYLFSDGYVDQFGGPRGKKLMYRPFREMLARISGQSCKQQLKEISHTMELWKSGQEQVDDILVLGIRL